MKTAVVGLALGLKGRVFTASPVPAGSKAALGMTLPEMMVSVAVGFLILTVMAVVFMTSARTFAAMGNYVTMDANSRNALDRMTREIRRTGNLAEFTPTHLKFVNLTQSNSFLVYDWDPDSRQLTEWQTGYTTTNVLLKECDQLSFLMENSLFAPTTNISDSKGITVNWKCSRTILGNKLTTENMEQALIVMRNKPL